MLIKPIRTKIFREHDDLFEFITAHIKKVPEKSVLVVTSKIVALAEGLAHEVVSQKEKDELIKRESDIAIKTKWVWLTIKDGVVMASAGVDESNGDGKIILLPKDSFKAARDLRKKLQEKYKVKNIGVLITDSRTLPLRRGVVGVALGYAGFKGIKDYRGTKDIFGKMFKFASTDVADSLATAAVLTMGEGAEKKPLALITDTPVTFCEQVTRNELHIDIKEDMYRPLFSNIPKKKRR